MSKLVLFEDDGYADLLPLVYWRSVFELQLGRKILLDRTAQALGVPIAGVWTRDWIAPVAAQRCGAPANDTIEPGTVLVNGRWLIDDAVTFPDPPNVGYVDDQIAFVVCDSALAAALDPAVMLDNERCEQALASVQRLEVPGGFLDYPWQAIGTVRETLMEDWEPGDAAIDTKLEAKPMLINLEWIHIGQRVELHPSAILDATNGPVFISDDVVISPYCVIEGPTYIGPGSRLHPYAWLHGGNAIGPVCKIGGELDGCTIHGYTNKQHAGFLGHAYLGSWVNIGAGATNSDLKNTYGTIRVPINGQEVDSGQTFFGGVVGDHAKIGINATMPTGMVMGFAASVATTRVLPKWIPSLCWITDAGASRGRPERLLDVATTVMARRGIDMTDEEVELFLNLAAHAAALETGPDQADSSQTERV